MVKIFARFKKKPYLCRDIITNTQNINEKSKPPHIALSATAHRITGGEWFLPFRPDNNNTITWSSRFAIITEDNLYEMSPVEVLNHEIDHALKYDTDPVQQKKDFDSKDPDYGNLEEKRVIMGSEQETARKLGKLEPGEVTRNNHNGTAYETTSPTSTEPKWSCTPQEN